MLSAASCRAARRGSAGEPFHVNPGGPTRGGQRHGSAGIPASRRAGDAGAQFVRDPLVEALAVGGCCFRDGPVQLRRDAYVELAGELPPGLDAVFPAWWRRLLGRLRPEVRLLGDPVLVRLPWLDPRRAQPGGDRSTALLLGTPRPRETASQAIDVFEQITRDVLPEGIQNDLHPLTPCELRSGNEIGVAGNENDDLRLALQRDGRNIQANPHVHALLAQRRGEVLVRNVIERQVTV